MNYNPTRNTKQNPIVKESAIGKSKAADFIGYWLYRFISLFKKSMPEPNESFLYLVGKLNYPLLKYYRNKQNVECVDCEVNGFKLVIGFQNGYILLRLNNGKLAVDKAIRGQNVTPKYIQEVKGLINSMQVSLTDKIKKAAYTKITKSLFKMIAE